MVVFGLELVEDMLDNTIFIYQEADTVQAVIFLAHIAPPLEKIYDENLDYFQKSLSLIVG